jgi:hypothetical protein
METPMSNDASRRRLRHAGRLIRRIARWLADVAQRSLSRRHAPYF